MLKAPPVNSRAYAFLVLKCNCWTHNDNFGHIFRNLRFATLGALKIRLTNVGPRFIRTIASLLTFLSGIDHCQPFSYFKSFFEHILEHINTPLSNLSWKSEKYSPQG